MKQYYFLFPPLQNVLNSVWQICDKLWQKVCHTFCSGIRSQSNWNQIQTTYWVSIVSISIVQFCFWIFSPQDGRNPMWQMCDKCVTKSLSHICHTLVTARFSIPKSSDRVQRQDISMGGSAGPPRHRKPSAEARFSLLSSFWPVLGFVRLGFGLTEPPNLKIYISEAEKYKVEHLIFQKHQKLSVNSSWAPRSMIFKRIFLHSKKIIVEQNDLTL